jgi:inner membrane protein
MQSWLISVKGGIINDNKRRINSRMDPLSQGVLGAAAPQSMAPREHLGIAGLLGFLAGMAPDLDVFIRSSNDPLLFLEFHRQFTHSLLFIPLGGLLCGLLLHQVFGRRRGLTRARSIAYCTLGYATHALLDACTTYGTQLLWPFSNTRYAWNTVSVIDPLFTLPVLLLTGISVLRRNPVLARLGLAWALIYPGIGLIQRERAEAVGWQIAESRGHQPLALEAKPSFANLVLWKVVYQTPDTFYVDGVRAGLKVRVFDGDSVPRLDLERDFPWLDHSTQQARDVARFHWFSNGYVAVDPLYPDRITDIRYSFLPDEISGLWSIQLSPDAAPDDHVAYLTSRDAPDSIIDRFKSMLVD